MHLHHVLLVLTTIYFAGLITANPDEISSVASPDNVDKTQTLGHSRNLRVDGEERVGIPVVSSLAAKMRAAKEAKETAKEAAKWKQVDDWFNEFRTPHEVKVNLKLGNKLGAKLPKNKNSKFYQAYLTKFEGRFDDFLERDLPTYNVWMLLGLDKFKTIKIFKRIKDSKRSDEIEMYVKYVNMFDNKAIEADKLPNPDIFEVLWPASKFEFVAKLAIRTYMRRPEEYVKASLGLAGKTGEELTEHVNYRYFKGYLDDVAKPSS